MPTQFETQRARDAAERYAEHVARLSDPARPSRRVRFTSWGRGAIEDGYVIVQDGERAIEAVVRRVERVTGHRVCGGPQSQGQTVERGEVVSSTYSVTLGDPCRSGGYAVVVDVWVALEED